ncbi:MAG: hypothetical protein JWO36_5093 [Myxococcales bacterium]|nr:hypothetical protein [Myxococcales bacterium]
MDTRKLEESSRLIGSVSWSAIASGTVIALALQTVLLLLGLAFATSVGDQTPGGGFGLWLVVVELLSIAVGAALTARLSPIEHRMSGVAAGVMTWALVLVLGGMFQGLTMTRGLGGTGAWALFIGAIISLAAAIVGGMFGSRLGGSSGSISAPPDYDETIGRPAAPVH